MTPNTYKDYVALKFMRNLMTDEARYDIDAILHTMKTSPEVFLHYETIFERAGLHLNDLGKCRYHISLWNHLLSEGKIRSGLSAFPNKFGLASRVDEYFKEMAGQVS